MQIDAEACQEYHRRLQDVEDYCKYVADAKEGDMHTVIWLNQQLDATFEKIVARYSQDLTKEDVVTQLRTSLNEVQFVYLDLEKILQAQLEGELI